VAHGERTNLNELFEMVKQLIGRFDKDVLNLTPSYGPVRAGDIPHSLASVEKAGRLLGYKPTHTVREGMEVAIDWYRANL
jgi:UDP-N-acetylglucosamine 4-epimerase